MGTTYYSTISAYDGDGNESWVSSNVTATAESTPVKLGLTTQPGNGYITGDPGFIAVTVVC
jgi:hypothetical protein